MGNMGSGQTIVDEILPEVQANWLDDLCKSTEFPWYYMSNPTYEGAQGRNSFAHLAMWEGVPRSDVYNRIEPILRTIAKEAEMDYNSLYRVRFGMYLPCHVTDPEHNQIHTDHHMPHRVALYYVNNADGPTYFFDDNDVCTNKIEPKRGRLVVFDGTTRHASTCPMVTNVRITLNLNFAT